MVMPMKGKMIKRVLYVILGTALLGVGSGCFRTAGLGMDALGSMILGISDFTGISYGSTQLMLNGFLLVVMFFLDRRNIGIGTVISMAGVGYVSDFVVWLLKDVAGFQPEGFLRSVMLIPAMFFLSFGIAFYMTPALGTAPYDDVAVIIEGISKRRIKFQYARIITDVVSMGIGITFALLAGESVFRVLGVGTLVNALLTGPLIQICRKYFALPLMKDLIVAREPERAEKSEQAE